MPFGHISPDMSSAKALAASAWAPEATKWWAGEKTVPGLDGYIDRSATLFNIGLVLAGANASPETIVAALGDRDEALGYAKYSERKDADVRYADIAGRAVSVQKAQHRRHTRPSCPNRGPAWQVCG